MNSETNARPPSSSSAAEDVVDELLFGLLELQQDQRPDALQRLCELHPEHAATLRRRLALLARELPAAMAEGGEETFGRFRLVRRLGGGMAEVHLAEDICAGTEVVLKILRHPQLLDEQERSSLAREEMAASRLATAGVCRVLELGSVNGVPYLVRPYVPGLSLAQWIQQRQARGRAIGIADLDLVLGWVETILRTLQLAHEQGLVHRDCKPSNILLPFQGQPLLLDFGLCREWGASEVALAPQPLAGTLAYMAPESISRDAPAALPAVDVYAMGVTLYECVTFRLPFESGSPQALSQAILMQEPPDPRRFARRVSKRLARVIARAMAKKPSERYATAAEFADDLGRVRQEGLAASSSRRPAFRAADLLSRRQRSVLAVIGCSTLLAIVFAKDLFAGGAGPDADLVALVERVRAASERAESLVPGWPDQIDALDDWIREVGEPLAAALPRLQTRIAELEHAPDADAVSLAALRIARERLTAFAVGEHSMLAVVRERLAWARTVRARTIEAPAELWRQTAAAIAADPRYGGLRLIPQFDLVPIGRDPESGLFEFHHPRSSGPASPPPERGADGRLVMHELTGLVFVLVPGGTCLLGEQPFDPAAPRYDPDASIGAQPFRFEFEAFFVSKYEMTQGQWYRLTGERPSYFHVGRSFDGDPPVSFLHPVESVDAPTCDRVLGRIGLQLPTEAQWEYACGAGKPSRWFFGDDPRELPLYGNIDDRRFLATRPGALGTMDVDDGFASSAPVGRYRANPFGLFDVIGNVAEWCRDLHGDHDQSRPAPGDGMRIPRGEATMRSYRGSCYLTGGHKTSSRPACLPDARSPWLGLRPVRPVHAEGR